ncbi:YtxH domain-containing protein [Bacillaceae bacterium Marseille-Q3522]|nr:YtxH domain-containing protein [Bacillaceae bacterium Marseille-Q3522]
MMANNKFWTGVILGAIAGGAISLLDRSTRKEVKETCTKAVFYVKHPEEAAAMVKNQTEKISAKAEVIREDVSFISEKIQDFKKITPEVVDMVKETKEAFQLNGKNKETSD